MNKEKIQMFREGYGLEVREMNEYQIRLSNEEYGNVFFDWYHTTGSLVVTVNGKPKKLQKNKDAETTAINIKKYLTCLRTRVCPCCGSTVTNE